MLSPIQNVKYNYNIPLYKSEQIKQSRPQVSVDNSSMLLKTLDCIGRVSFGSLQSGLNKLASSTDLSKLMAESVSTSFSPYEFLKRNPLGFYMEYGKEMNKFLRSGTFEPLPELTDDVPEFLRKYISDQIVETMNLNRTIFESVEVLKSKITSKTNSPMIVWRDAPKSWMDAAKNGQLIDDAFLSVSTEKGASLEGVISNGADNFTYEIHLPSGVDYWDLTHTAEKEMVLLPGRRFEILSPGVLKLVL